MRLRYLLRYDLRITRSFSSWPWGPTRATTCRIGVGRRSRFGAWSGPDGRTQSDTVAGPGLLSGRPGERDRDPRSSTRGVRPCPTATSRRPGGQPLPRRPHRFPHTARHRRASTLALAVLAGGGRIPGRASPGTGGHPSADRDPRRRPAGLVCRLPRTARTGPVPHRAGHGGRLPPSRGLGIVRGASYAALGEIPTPDLRHLVRDNLRITSLRA